MVKASMQKDFATLLQDFFCHRLIQQRRVSPHTVKSYRDTFRLLLHFANKRLRKQITKFNLTDFDAPLILAFLDHLETQRQNSIRSRNARLAAIRSFMHFAGLQAPEALPVVQQILAIPMKRFERPALGHLSRTEIEALLMAPDPNTWSGRRDRILLTVLYNTGARVSEIIAIKRSDVECERCTAVHLQGKGRKERVVPLWKRTTQQLREWLFSLASASHQPLFPNRFGHPLTRSGIEKRLQAAAAAAGQQCVSLKTKKVSPHILRHTTAMHLLQSGVDLTVIALWLGHESVTTTHDYLQADIQMKEQALARLQPPNVSRVRYKPSKDLLAFLDGL